MPYVLHLVTQDDQPYGSVRRCCERCGAMIPSPSDTPWFYTDRRDLYAKADGMTPGLDPASPDQTFKRCWG